MTWSARVAGWLTMVVLAAGCEAAPPPPPPAQNAPAPAPAVLAIVDAATADVSVAPADCPPMMQLVSGEYCPYVGHRCVEWIDEKRDRCRRYAPPPICEGRIRSERFCIDRYEYPNIEGVYPVVMVSFLDAREACRAEGKRLCTEDEWNFACEGEERLPYPYGYERDDTACNIDRAHILPNFEAFSDDWKVGAEVSRLDKRVKSGEMPRCVSPFDVHDMTGNVDEWVVNELPDRDAGIDISSLKGGYFGPIRARCRPATHSHNRWFRFYQVGFRCCAEAAPQTAHD